MFGDTKETYLSPSGTMTVKKGKYYNTYSTAFGNYIGRHELLELKSCNGMPLAVLTLISEANYEKLTDGQSKGLDHRYVVIPDFIIGCFCQYVPSFCEADSSEFKSTAGGYADR